MKNLETRLIEITRKTHLNDYYYKLKIYVDGVFVSHIQADETISIQIDQNSKVIHGKMFWAKTKAFDLQSLSDENRLVLKPYFTANPFKLFGLIAYPLEFIEE